MIFGAGTGNPYFTTDTAGALRAIEVEADVIQYRVDGIYDADPELNLDAIKFDTITGDEVLKTQLSVMDLTVYSMP